VEYELWSVEGQLDTPILASAQRHSVRKHLFLRITHNGILGYGEISPQPVALNGDPGYETVVGEIIGPALAMVLSVVDREGTLPAWSRVNRFAGSRSESLTAMALIEMAAFDWQLRSAKRDAVDDLGARSHPRLQSVASLLSHTSNVAASTCEQIRLKVSPKDLTQLDAEFLQSFEHPLLLDFNCSARTAEEVIELVQNVSEHAKVIGVEQPFAPGNLIDHSQLAQRLSVVVSLDEGVRSLRDIDNIARYEAASMVCIKPARIGGIAMTRTAISRSIEFGLVPYIGGFFESSLARRLNFLLASTPEVGPSDVGELEALRHQFDFLTHVEFGLGLGFDDRISETSTLISSSNNPGL